MTLVCEFHPTKAWPDECSCGAGMTLTPGNIAGILPVYRHLFTEISAMSNMPAEKMGEHEKRLAEQGLTPAPGGPVPAEMEASPEEGNPATPSDANDKPAKSKPKSAPAKASQPVKRGPRAKR